MGTKRKSKVTCIGCGLMGVFLDVEDYDEKRIIVTSPYNTDFIAIARKSNGTWSPSKKGWIFDKRDESRIREALIDIYGTDGSFKPDNVDVKIVLEKVFKEGNTFSMFGRNLLYCPAKHSKIRMDDGVVIDEGNVYSGGSSKYPMIRYDKGTVLIVRDVPVKLVDEAIAKYPDAIEVIADKPQIEAPIMRKNIYLKEQQEASTEDKKRKMLRLKLKAKAIKIKLLLNN